MDSVTANAWASGKDPWSESRAPDAIVVFDTNVLITHLNFVRRLIDTHGTEASRWPSASQNGRQKALITFLIPWIVVQELDGLKSHNRGGSEVNLGDKARAAIKYLEDELVKPLESRRIRAQKLTEHIENQQSNDDNILDCCRYFHNMYAGSAAKVTLFSNDRNLCVKAMIHDIRTLSHNRTPFEVGSVIEAILGSGVTPSVQDDMMMDEGNDANNSPTAPVWDLLRNSSTGSTLKARKSTNRYRSTANDHVIQQIKASKVTTVPEGMNPMLFQLTSHVIKNLRSCLEFAVPDHLRAYYGDDWETRYGAASVKPEDAEYDCKCLALPIRSLQEYWGPVFSGLYRSKASARSHLNNLQAFIKIWDRVETFGLGKVYKKDLTAFLVDVEVVLEGLLTKPKTSSATSTAGNGTHQPTHDLEAHYYDATNRRQLLEECKHYCRSLED